MVPLLAAVAAASGAVAAASGAVAATGGRDLTQIGRGAAPELTVVAPPPASAPTPPLTSSTAVEGDLRLVSQVVTNGFTTGALQVFHDGQFGAVCKLGFDAVDAAVACVQLGFPAGGFALNSLFPVTSMDSDVVTPPNLQDIQAPFVLENLGCTGAEARLVDCPVAENYDEYDSFVGLDYSYSDGLDRCEPFGQSYAFVACGAGAASAGPAEGDLRLAGGGTSPSGAQFGRLEIFASGGWGTICGELRGQFRPSFFGTRPAFTEASADVACQQLGFQEGALTATPRFVSDELRRVPIAAAGVSCGGSEDFLADCPGFSLGNNTDVCGHVNDVSLVCFNGPDPAMDGMLRLMGGAAGPGYEYGRLEVFLRGFWSSVCNIDGFTPDSAAVACRALGFGGGASLEFFQPFSRSPASVLDAKLPVGLAAVNCEGTEVSLLACPSDESGIRTCSADDGNAVDATIVACGNSAAGCGQTPPEVEGSVRLVGGFGTLCDPLHTGIVEVFHFGEWGALCFDDRDDDMLVADVVCRQLGFPHGTPVDPTDAEVDSTPDYYFGPYGPGSGVTEESQLPQERFWLSAASCRGTEVRLVDCDLGPGFRTNNRGCGGAAGTRFQAACRQFAVSEALEDVATPGAVEGDVRLVNETVVANWQVGRLEIFFEGAWSQVCREAFDSPDADVVCRQLGYGAGSVAATGPAQPEDLLVYPVVAVTLPACNGTEATLLSCGREDVLNLGPFRSTSGRGCFSDAGPGLILACVAEPLSGGMEGAVRLVDTEETGNVTIGTPQIFHAGAWGSICAPDSGATDRGFFDYNGPRLSEASAAILCMQLGFQDGIFASLESVPANTTLLPPWLNALGCVGGEPALTSCDNGAFGSVSTCGLTQQLVCSSGSGVPTGMARLVGGSADPGGSWAYGRLEVFDGLAFSRIVEFPAADGVVRNAADGVGRNAAVVACRSLGFADGVEIIAGSASAVPGDAGDVDSIVRIACAGDEAMLGDCEIELSEDSGYMYEDVPESSSVSVLCSTPSGCPAEAGPPAEGDVRLVPLINATSQSAPCDAVHQGVVQYFSDGVWQLICTSTFSTAATTGFDIDAKVICGQLGFPFGTRFDPSAVGGRDSDLYDYSYTVSTPMPLDGVPVFATRVSCTGKEERLEECFFPEQDFIYSYGQSPVGLPLPASCNERQAARLTVACRQFPVPESNVIRR